MARSVNRLKALGVKALLKKPGMHADGAGLWLCVTSEAAASWLLRYSAPAPYTLVAKTKGGGSEVRNRPAGSAREMGLGSAHTLSLEKARAAALAARNLIADGIDPLTERDRVTAKNAADAARAISFRQSAEAFIESHKAGWKNEKHAAQWTATLATYAFPIMGNVPVGDVDVALVHKVLEPIWTSKPETAHRVRGRMEAVLDWATARGYRSKENPARRRGHLQHLFPARGKVAEVKHQRAIPFAAVPGLMAELREHKGMSAKALEFAILTAARTGAVIGATWSEIDLEAAVWTVPAGRAGAKTNIPRRVPLSGRVIQLLKSLPRDSGNQHVFPGGRKGRGLSDAAMRVMLEHIPSRPDCVPHGFRSSFSDWVSEQTNYPREVREAALWHIVADKVEAAYRRGDLFEKRRRLMESWEGYCACTTPGGEVVRIRRESAAA